MVLVLNALVLPLAASPVTFWIKELYSDGYVSYLLLERAASGGEFLGGRRGVEEARRDAGESRKGAMGLGNGISEVHADHCIIENVSCGNDMG